MSEPLFDLADEYEAMLMRGVSLSGEHWSFFASGRVEELRRCLPATFAPRRILDFGCGIGHTTNLLAAAFPASEVVGIDTSADALRRAETTPFRKKSMSTPLRPQGTSPIVLSG